MKDEWMKLKEPAHKPVIYTLQAEDADRERLRRRAAAKWEE